MTSNFDTFRKLTPEKDKPIGSNQQSKYPTRANTHSNHSSLNFASRVSQCTTSSYSNEIILENIQSIQSLGFNAIETYQQLLPSPYIVKSKNNGIMPESYYSNGFSFRDRLKSQNSISNISLRSHNNHFVSNGSSLTANSLNTKSSTEQNSSY